MIDFFRINFTSSVLYLLRGEFSCMGYKDFLRSLSLLDNKLSILWCLMAQPIEGNIICELIINSILDIDQLES